MPNNFIIEPSPENVKKVFDNFYQADIKLWEEFSKKLIIRIFDKNEIIKDYNATERYMNILVKGSVASFVWNGENNICINLYYENNFFSDYLSFLRQTPTQIKQQALEHCLVWSISYKDLQELYSRSTTGIYIGKMIAEELFIKKQTEQINLLTLTPSERYQKLLEERPEIIKRTSLKIIASYLGLTAEGLSRIRKRISEI